MCLYGSVTKRHSIVNPPVKWSNLVGGAKGYLRAKMPISDSLLSPTVGGGSLSWAGAQVSMSYQLSIEVIIDIHLTM